MSRLVLKEEWKDQMLKAIFSPDFEYTTGINIAAKFLIYILDENKLPFRVLNLGVGTNKITRKVDTCPKCHGTGKI